jgi:mxaJ protein
MKRLLACVVLLVASMAAAQSVATAQRQALRICADPNNLPFSHRNERGFENKLAARWAERLGQEVSYTWFPQRLGFVRNTLRSQDESGRYKCDIVMGIVTGYELVMTTKPYYRSTYALVYVKGRGLDDVRSDKDFIGMDEERKRSVKVGVFDQTPGAAWLMRHGFGRQMVPFPAMSGDPDSYPGETIEEALINEELDAVIIWGPIGGYFARHADPHELAVIPLESEPGIRFDYTISAGVRHGDRETRARVEALIDESSEEIRVLLDEYNVPLLELEAAAGDAPEDDD